MINAAFRIIQPGLLTTIQDLGRLNCQRYGVPQGGAMDRFAMQAANLLLGNRRDAPCLEVTMMGPVLEAVRDTWIAVCGADLNLMVDGAPMPSNSSFLLKEGRQFRFGRRVSGARAYVAIAGGINVPAVLDSASTYLPAKIGGLDGRAMRAGDVLCRGDKMLTEPCRTLRAALPAAPIDEAVIRVVAGPHALRFSSDAVQKFYEGIFTVTPNADRMGCRLDGPAVPVPKDLLSGIVSEGIPCGTVQISPDGKPAILLADRPTIGGYAKLATVITADHSIVAQCAPGTKLRFALVTLDEAQSLARDADRHLRIMEWAIKQT